MVRVIGNSPELVEIKDLNDVVYYRQVKDFTDQQYEQSRDLKREINSGRLAKIDEVTAPLSAVEVPGNVSNAGNAGNTPSSSLSVKDLKIALREILPEIKGEGVSEDVMRGAMREVAPLIVEMVRQEVSKMTVTGVAPSESKSRATTSSTFSGPEYIPNIETSNMKDNVNVKEREVSADDVTDSLAALRQLKKKF